MHIGLLTQNNQQRDFLSKGAILCFPQEHRYTKDKEECQLVDTKQIILNLG